MTDLFCCSMFFNLSCNISTNPIILKDMPLRYTVLISVSRPIYKLPLRTQNETLWLTFPLTMRQWDVFVYHWKMEYLMIQEYSLRKEEVHSLLRTKFPNLSKSPSGTSLWKLLKRSALVFQCNLLKYKTVSPYQLWNWFQDSVFFWMNVISWVKINWCREGGCGKQHIGKQKGEQSFTFSTFTNI